MYVRVKSRYKDTGGVSNENNIEGYKGNVPQEQQEEIHAGKHCLGGCI